MRVQTTANLMRVTDAYPKRKIKIGFVMHVMQVAGAEVLVKQMIERLGDRIDATVFCLDGIGELGQQLVEKGTPVIALGRKPGIDIAVAKKLAVEIRSRKIDIIHAHQYTPFFYSALSRLIYRANVKIMFTEHGRHYPDVVSRRRRFINRYLLSRYAEVSTACCEFSAEALRRVEGFPKTVTLPNGVDLSGLPSRGNLHTQADLRASLGMSHKTPYAVCVARFHPVKDHQTLIKSWKIVNNHLPEARLLLIGDGECRGACEELTRQLGLTEAIEFRGIRHDVAKFLRAADVFTLTSVSEAASLTLLEAMASECPAVVTNVGGNAEHVTHGIDGYLEPRGDSNAIAARLIELLQSNSLTKQMGTLARQRVIRDFDLPEVIKTYSAYFDQLAAGKN